MTRGRDNRGADGATRNRCTPAEQKLATRAESGAAWCPTAETIQIVRELERRIDKQTAELDMSEARFRALVEQIPAVTYTAALDEASTTLYVSPQIKTMLGFTPEEYKANPDIWRQRLHPDDRERVIREVRERHNSHHPLDSEYRMVTRTGETIWIKDHATLVVDGKGKPIVMQGVMFDITASKQAAAKRAESEKKYRGLIEGLNDTVYRMTIPDGIYEYISSSGENVFGYTRKDFINNPLFIQSIIHPDSAGYFTEKWAELLAGSVPETYEYKIRDAKGNERWIMQSNRAIRDDAGGVKAIEGLCRNVTRLKLAETYREIGREILQILNEPGNLRQSIQYVLAVLKKRTGVNAVGIRLQDHEDFPYYVQDGFSPDFLLDENTLIERGKDGGLCRDEHGNLRLECACGLVISGRTDPANPLFTNGGSCWTNDSACLLDLPADQDPRLHPRNNCIHQGYASVALIPIRTRERIVGLLQLNDNRKGRFSLQTIEALEDIATYIGSALMRKQAAAKRAESEKLLSRSEEIAHIGSWQLDLSTNRLTWSVEAYRIFGVEPQGLGMTYDTFLDVVHPDDRAAVEKAYAVSLQEEKDGYEIEHRIVRRNTGEIRTVHERCIHECDDAGKILRSVGMVQDITERHQMQRNMNRISDELSQSSRMAMVGGWNVDITTGVHSWSEVTREIHDVGLDFVPDFQNAISFYKEGESRQKITNAVTHCMRTGEPYELDAQLITAKGRACWIRTIGKAEFCEGRCVRLFGAIQDITDRKHAEEDLRESEEKLRLIVENSSDLIWTVMPDGIISYISPACESILNYKLSDVVGKAFQVFIHPEDVALCEENIQETIHARKPQPEMQYRIKHANGSWRWNEGTISPVFCKEGALLHLVGISRDITDRKLTENYREIGREILETLNEPGDLQASIKRILATLKKRTEVNAVGLRLQEGKDFPYSAQDGFSKAFLRRENTLLERGKDGSLCRNKDGNASLRCICGMVISGQTDPANPLFTKGGSCWTNNALPLLALPPHQDLWLNQQNNCIHQGYASVALIPIRAKEQIVGLLQLNDKRTGLFTLETITMLEGIAAHIGSALLRKHMEEELTRTNKARRALIKRLEQIQEEERTRISRDMHDDLGQNITAIKMDLNWIERATGSAGDTPDIGAIRTRTRTAIDMTDTIAATVQELAASLRPGVLDKLGVGPAICFESRRFQTRTGILCRVNLSDTLPNIPEAAATALFRIFQECLTNVARHSNATQASVRMRSKAGIIVLRIHDNGKGIAQEALDHPESLGLLGMIERAADAGGHILLRRGQRRGTLITIRIPLQ